VVAVAAAAVVVAVVVVRKNRQGAVATNGRGCMHVLTVVAG
jgi:hypothetical protein